MRPRIVGWLLLPKLQRSTLTGLSDPVIRRVLFEAGVL
jgi:hypothetical protein